MRKLTRFLKDFKKQVFLGPFFKWIEAVFELIVPLVMAKIIDIGVKNNDTGYILRMGGVILLLGIVGLACSLTCQRYAAQASQGFGTKVRSELFRHVMSLSHSEIDRIGTQSLITRITADVNQLQLAVAMLIRLVVRAPFLVIGAIVMAMMIDLSLSTVFLVVTPLIIFAVWLIMSRSIPHFKILQKKLDAISVAAGENLAGARVIRAFAKQDYEESRAAHVSQEYTQTAVRVGRISALLNPITYLILNFAVIAVIWFGGFQVDTGRLTQGEIVAFVNYLSQILVALLVVANLVIIFTRASASAARVNEIFETVSSIQELASSESGQPIEFKNAEFAIEFQDVTFGYDNGAPAIHEVALRIYPSQTVGIIGGTGSGKTTLVNLIPRFYDASQGCVRVLGRDVREYPLSQLRKIVSIVPQKAVLFNGTIRENLSFRMPDATEEEIWQALRIAQASDFVSALPDQLNTIVLEGGKNFSGGQKQRLTIARALVGSPPIVIFDDSSSALDYTTDANLRKALRQNLSESTVITVSQRATSIKQADLIVVLDDGDIVGMGNHQSLLENCPVYQEICKSQSALEETHHE